MERYHNVSKRHKCHAVAHECADRSLQTACKGSGGHGRVPCADNRVDGPDVVGRGDCNLWLSRPHSRRIVPRAGYVFSAFDDYRREIARIKARSDTDLGGGKIQPHQGCQNAPTTPRFRLRAHGPEQGR